MKYGFSYGNHGASIFRVTCFPAIFFGTLLGIANAVSAVASPIAADLEPVPGVADLLRDPKSYTVAEIMAVGGIVIGDKLFDSFDVTTTKSQNAIAPTPAEISLTPIQVLKPGAVFGGDYGFIVNGAWSALAGQMADSTIEFRASILPEYTALGCAFDDNALWMTAFGVGGEANAGAVSVSENLYTSHPGLGAPSFVNEFVYYRNDTDKVLRDAATFAPVTQLWVVKDVVAYGGTGATGAAHISEFYQTFSQCPEPGTLILLGIAGISAAVWLGCKRR